MFTEYSLYFGEGWTEDETSHLREHMGPYINNLKVPGKNDCEEYLKKLKKKRTWNNIKDKVNAIVQQAKRTRKA